MATEGKKTEESPDQKLRIYFLPNLMTAGNLFCGFVALTKIVEARVSAGDFSQIKVALGFILLAGIFDLLDGRVARMGGTDSPFGREFDSLADIISFGAAPAFLVHRIVLKDVFVANPQVGWFIASIYLICGALRLARFNCLAAMGGSASKEFTGFPIPAAAILVASVTLLIVWWEERELAAPGWRYVLPVIMLILSFMMVSEVKYPSFKTLDFKAKRTFPKLIFGVLLIGGIVILHDLILPLVLPVFMTAYLIYGFVRPHISRKVRHEIEEEEDDEDDEP
jgi:CDP-diacylglycerol--serine O-phosphatidyltransferase